MNRIKKKRSKKLPTEHDEDSIDEVVSEFIISDNTINCKLYCLLKLNTGSCNMFLKR